MRRRRGGSGSKAEEGLDESSAITWLEADSASELRPACSVEFYAAILLGRKVQHLEVVGARAHFSHSVRGTCSASIWRRVTCREWENVDIFGGCQWRLPPSSQHSAISWHTLAVSGWTFSNPYGRGDCLMKQRGTAVRQCESDS